MVMTWLDVDDDDEESKLSNIFFNSFVFLENTIVNLAGILLGFTLHHEGKLVWKIYLQNILC